MESGDKKGAVSALEQTQHLYPKSAQASYVLAQGYIAVGETASAIESLNRAIALKPDYIEATILLAETHIRKGDFSDASIAMKKLLQAHPGFLQGMMILADADRGLDNFDDALSIYRQIDRLYPGRAETSLLRGLVLLRMNQNEQARLAFSEAIHRAPGYAPAIEQLVNLDIAEKRYPEALNLAKSLVENSQKTAEPWLLLARVYLAQNDINNAEPALLRAIDSKSDLPSARLLLARIYVGTNRPKEAIADLKDLIAMSPKAVGALMMLSSIYEQQKEYPLAMDAYQRVLAIDSKFGPALNNLAYLYSERLGQLEKAFETAQKAHDLNPDEPHTADTLGWILYKRRQYSWALNLLQESAVKLPASAETQYHLGMALYMMGDEARSRPALEAALKLDPNFPGSASARESLGILAIDVGSMDRNHLGNLEQTLAKKPDDPVALFRLAELYERQAMTDKAEAAYKDALKLNHGTSKSPWAWQHYMRRPIQSQKALELAKDARKLRPNDPAIALTLEHLALRQATICGQRAFFRTSQPQTRMTRI